MGKIFGLAHTCLFVRVKNDMLRKLYAPNEKSFSSSLAASVTERFFRNVTRDFFSECHDTASRISGVFVSRIHDWIQLWHSFLFEFRQKCGMNSFSALFVLEKFKGVNLFGQLLVNYFFQPNRRFRSKTVKIYLYFAAVNTAQTNLRPASKFFNSGFRNLSIHIS